jgi:uncharacterized protein (TIGR03437 family)
MAQRSRITGRINASQWTALSGSVHPDARSEFDQGKADGSMAVNTVTIALKPSAEQQQELDQLLADQQNPASASYHKWLTPEGYADRFGLSQADIDKIVAWAQSQQLTVTGVARARNAVMLQGTAGQFDNAFRTEIHLYQVNGETHYANATAPYIPAAMQNVVLAVHGLHNFRLKPRAHQMRELGVAADGVTPNYTSSTSGNHYLAPDDFSTIFDVGPLYLAGIDGSGQRIVIVGQSQIVSSHLSTFTTYFGLADVDLTTVLVPNTQDPGIKQSDEQESDLDLQWAAAVARRASLIFVYTSDVTNAVQYAIDQNLAPVISMSYGECESSGTRADAITMRAWAQQGNAQGITWVAASGDSGAAGCYQATSGPFGGANSSLSLAAGLPVSIPEVTGVGGTTLNEGTGSYWNATNGSTKGSALSYIPETSWNDSVSDGSPSASGGGASVFFSKPTWQTGTGVPTDGARDVPDVALPASADHDGYMVYTSSGKQSTWYVFGGTSCGTPAFAGMLALLNQYMVSNGYQSAAGLGNVNSQIYSLAASAPNSFHDITSGNNMVTVTCSSPRCTGNSTSGGYTAAAGYDLVTGLGSVDTYRFVTAWYSGRAIAKSTPTVSVTASPSTLSTGGSTTLTMKVVGNDITTPTGTVTFSAGSTTLGTATLSPGSGSATASLTVLGSTAALTSGANTISAVYDGDNSYNAATGSATLTVVSVTSFTPAITGATNAASYRDSYVPGMLLSVFGSGLALSTNVASTAPLPTLLDNVSVAVNGVAAPLLYISPTQLNVQIPYETAASGTATVVVNNNGKMATLAIPMAAAAPGIFADTAGAVVPTSSAARGQTIAIYVTGVGAVEPSVATGATPASGTTPVPTGKTVVTVGGIEAATTYIGIPSWSVGVLQINLTVPDGVGLGQQQVVVSVGGLVSAGAVLVVE